MKFEHSLQKYFGHTEFRFRQKETIGHLLNGNNILSIMPTGSGKSILYQLPALLLENLTIVISPLIALMKDQVDALKAKDIDAAYINSSLKKYEREKRYQDIASGKYKIVYVTPERFRKTEFINVLKTRKISLLAVDEAHCISQWGHDFRPDYTRLKAFRKIMDNPLTIALTATATPDVQQDIVEQLGLKDKEITLFHGGIERPNLFLAVKDVWSEEEKKDAILDIIDRTLGSGIVYFTLIKDLMSMSRLLQQNNRPHRVYHGELIPGIRSKVQNAFMAGKNQLILATNAFGMGIDKENIRYIIHAQVPGSLESYYQEVGRAGRDGKDSFCTLLYDEQDLSVQMEFIRSNNPGADFFKRAYNMLKSDLERINGEGIEYFREQMSFKDRKDRRVDTVISVFDRYGVIAGDLEKRNILLLGPLHKKLTDREYLETKHKTELIKLYKMLEYTKIQTGHKQFIHDYFGVGRDTQLGE